MEQPVKQHRILGHAVGREITMQELAQVAGGDGSTDGGIVGTRPFRVGNQTLYMDLGPDPSI